MAGVFLPRQRQTRFIMTRLLSSYISPSTGKEPGNVIADYQLNKKGIEGKSIREANSIMNPHS
jgi:hypothetical protein